MRLSVPILKLPEAEDLPLPSYATELSAGVDLYAAVPGVVSIAPQKRAVIPTGIAVALPPDCEAQIRSRSGLAAKSGVFVLNSPGTVDADYRGEIKVILHNAGDTTFLVKRGMRIAQMIIAPVLHVQWRPVAALPGTERGKNGFGSTGVY